MKTTESNARALIKIFHSNLNEFLLFSVALVDEINALELKPECLTPEQILLEKKKINTR